MQLVPEASQAVQCYTRYLILEFFLKHFLEITCDIYGVYHCTPAGLLKEADITSTRHQSIYAIN